MSNARSTMNVVRDRGQVFACFDALPWEIRAILNYAPIAFDPVDAFVFWRQRAIVGGVSAATAMLADRLREVTSVELAQFAFAYECEHELPLPHVAAEATALGF